MESFLRIAKYIGVILAIIGATLAAVFFRQRHLDMRNRRTTLDTIEKSRTDLAQIVDVADALHAQATDLKETLPTLSTLQPPNLEDSAKNVDTLLDTPG
jgi:hypothetical protein